MKNQASQRTKLRIDKGSLRERSRNLFDYVDRDITTVRSGFDRFDFDDILPISVRESAGRRGGSRLADESDY